MHPPHYQPNPAVPSNPENRVDAFIKQLNWYDNGVRQDGYVIGFTLFTAGGHDYWERYDVNSILPQLIDYMRSQQ